MEIGMNFFNENGYKITKLVPVRLVVIPNHY